MTANEYFGDWMQVIDETELMRVMRWLKHVNPAMIRPDVKDIFKAFRLCPYRDCRVIMLGQDPYPQPGVATGILFGNSADTPEHLLSPSLKVVKESVINYEIPHNRIDFDNTLESWAKQGILMINTALTCEVNSVGSHVPMWRPFVAKLVKNMCEADGGLLFVLFGRQAQSFKPFITNNHSIIEIEHPAYFARRQEIMPYKVFTEIKQYVKYHYGDELQFYKETEYGTC